MYQYGMKKIPKFAAASVWSKKDNEYQWEVRHRRILAVKDTSIVLVFGDESEEDLLEFYAQAHNMNILLGISDDDYNLSISSP